MENVIKFVISPLVVIPFLVQSASQGICRKLLDRHIFKNPKKRTRNKHSGVVIFVATQSDLMLTLYVLGECLLNSAINLRS